MTITATETDYVFPQNEKEITKNRKRYVRALRLAKKQCRGSLITKDGKRCAVGVGVALFFGIKTQAELITTAKTNPRWDVYGDFARMVGLSNATPNEFSDDLIQSPTDIWRLNDSHGKTLREIGDRLAREWDIA